MPSVKTVELARAEGPSALCVAKTYRSIKEAQLALDNQALTFPEKSVDKVDFIITWDDGQKYHGTWYATRNRDIYRTLAGHVRHHSMFVLRHWENLKAVIDDEGEHLLRGIVEGSYSLK